MKDSKGFAVTCIYSTIFALKYLFIGMIKTNGISICYHQKLIHKVYEYWTS